MAGLADAFKFVINDPNSVNNMSIQSAGGYGQRHDGSTKGGGLLGPLLASDGSTMTEVSADTTLRNGQNLHFPLISQSQGFKELSNLLTGGKPSDSMYETAINDALSRKLTGRDPFAGIGEQTTLGASFGDR